MAIEKVDVDAIQKRLGGEFRDLDWIEDDWELVEDEIIDSMRWVNVCQKILRHTGGMHIAIVYESNVADGESADSDNDEWYEVEPVEKTVVVYEPVQKNA